MVYLFFLKENRIFLNNKDILFSEIFWDSKTHHYYFYLTERDVESSIAMINNYINKFNFITYILNISIKNSNQILSFTVIITAINNCKLKNPMPIVVKNYISIVGSQINIEKNNEKINQETYVFNNYKKLYQLYEYCKYQNINFSSVFTPFNITWYIYKKRFLKLEIYSIRLESFNFGTSHFIYKYFIYIKSFIPIQFKPIHFIQYSWIINNNFIINKFEFEDFTKNYKKLHLDEKKLISSVNKLLNFDKFFFLNVLGYLNTNFPFCPQNEDIFLKEAFFGGRREVLNNVDKEVSDVRNELHSNVMDLHFKYALFCMKTYTDSWENEDQMNVVKGGLELDFFNINMMLEKNKINEISNIIDQQEMGGSISADRSGNLKVDLQSKVREEVNTKDGGESLVKTLKKKDIADIDVDSYFSKFNLKDTMYIFNCDLPDAYFNTLKYKFPVGTHKVKILNETSGYKVSIKNTSFYKCKVYQPSHELPVLPYRDGKVIYPEGIFTGIWFGEELNLFISEGGGQILEVYTEYWWDVWDYNFLDLLNYLNLEEGIDSTNKWIYKKLKTTFFGSMAIKDSKHQLKNIGMDVDDLSILDNSNFESDYYNRVSNIYNAAIITARCRIQIYKILVILKVERILPLYIHTDSIDFYTTVDKWMNLQLRYPRYLAFWNKCKKFSDSLYINSSLIIRQNNVGEDYYEQSSNFKYTPNEFKLIKKAFFNLENKKYTIKSRNLTLDSYTHRCWVNNRKSTIPNRINFEEVSEERARKLRVLKHDEENFDW